MMSACMDGRSISKAVQYMCLHVTCKFAELIVHRVHCGITSVDIKIA